MNLKDYVTTETQLVFFGLVSKSTGALYGVLTMIMFSKSVNLNLWILSSIVTTIITLANVLIVPSSGNINKQSLYQETGLSLSKLQFSEFWKRLVIAVIVHIGILFFVLVGSKSSADKILILIVFAYQGLQLPFVLQLLERNESSYFLPNRIQYLRVSSIGNSMSLVSVIAYFCLGIPIDQTIYSFCIFLTIQTFILIMQNYLHAQWTNVDSYISHGNGSRILNPLRKKMQATIRIYLYVPCTAALISFSGNNDNFEIGATFLGLNIMTLITYLGLPNNKFIYSIESPSILFRSIRKILLKSLGIFLVTTFLLLLFIQFLQFFQFLPHFLESNGLKNILLMSFLGIFLLPIVIIENNRKLIESSNNWQLNITSFVLGGVFVLMNRFERSTLMSSIFVSFLASFVVWYSIALYRSMNWQGK